MSDKQYLGRPGEGLLNNPSLPTVVPFGNLRIHIDMYKKERDFREISSLMKAASEEGIGFDSKEFVTNDDVDRKLNKSVGYILRDTSETGPLVAASFMVPCSLSRSERPVYWGGNGVVSKKYRSQGIAEFLLTAIRHLSRGQGHNAVLARHTITAKSNLPGRSCGAVYLGIIPKSIRIRKPNVVADDIIVFYGDHWREKGEDNEVQPPSPADGKFMKLPDLKFGYSFASINTPLPITLETKQVRSINGESLSIQEVSAAEYSQVECKIRNAAESGSMIGLDELTDSGLWNRSFLRKTHVLGTYNEKNEMVGVALFGPSSICRTDSIIISGYVILDQRYQFQGLESVLVETIIDISKKLSFEGVLLDVYRTEWKFIGLLMDMGFKVTGSLPKCGYLKGKGYIDSVLLYKEFVIGSSKL